MPAPAHFEASAIRSPAPEATCTCSHWADCVCRCHDRHCDPVTDSCHVDFLPDDGGLVRYGCPACSPGQGAPHHPGCELIGWNVQLPSRRLSAVASTGRRRRT